MTDKPDRVRIEPVDSVVKPGARVKLVRIEGGPLSELQDSVVTEPIYEVHDSIDILDELAETS